MPSPSNKPVQAVRVQNYFTQLLADHFHCKAEFSKVNVLLSPYALSNSSIVQYYNVIF